MNARASMERNSIANDLSNIVRELEQIALELRRIEGAGVERCAAKLTDISNKYTRTKNQLYRF